VLVVSRTEVPLDVLNICLLNLNLPFFLLNLIHHCNHVRVSPVLDIFDTTKNSVFNVPVVFTYSKKLLVLFEKFINRESFCCVFLEAIGNKVAELLTPFSVLR